LPFCIPPSDFCISSPSSSPGTSISGVGIDRVTRGPGDTVKERPGCVSDRHGFALDRHGTALDRHGFALDRHGTALDRHGAAPDRHGTALDRHGTVPDMHGTAPVRHGTAPDMHGTALDMHGSAPGRPGRAFLWNPAGKGAREGVLSEAKGIRQKDKGKRQKEEDQATNAGWELCRHASLSTPSSVLNVSSPRSTRSRWRTADDSSAQGTGMAQKRMPSSCDDGTRSLRRALPANLSSCYEKTREVGSDTLVIIIPHGTIAVNLNSQGGQWVDIFLGLIWAQILSDGRC
jgi:hypothetical protein